MNVPSRLESFEKTYLEIKESVKLSNISKQSEYVLNIQAQKSKHKNSGSPKLKLYFENFFTKNIVFLDFNLK